MVCERPFCIEISDFTRNVKMDKKKKRQEKHPKSPRKSPETGRKKEKTAKNVQNHLKNATKLDVIRKIQRKTSKTPLSQIKPGKESGMVTVLDFSIFSILGID